MAEPSSEGPTTSDARWAVFGRAVLLVATAVFVCVDATMGAHSDDVQFLEQARHSSYAELFTQPFFGTFYRPVVVVIMKALGGLSADPVAPVRWLHAALVATCVAVAQTSLRARTSALATSAAALCLLGSPFTFVSATPFVVGLSDLIVALAFLLSVPLCRLDRRIGTPLGLLALATVAMFSKESGLLVALYGVVDGARRKRYGTSVLLAAAAIGFVVLRARVVPATSFTFDSGFLFAYLDVRQLHARFDASPYGFYVYNVAANLLACLTSEPDRGYLEASSLDLVRIPIFVATSAFIGRFLATSAAARREHLPLVAVVLGNAALGFLYVRPRIMFTAALAIAWLLALAIDDALRTGDPIARTTPRTLAIGFLLVWTGMTIGTLTRLPAQAAEARVDVAAATTRSR